jgi:flagellar motor switch protein FliM
MARLCKDMVRNLEETWRPVTEVEISDIELETNPEFMQITAASEIVILMAFEVNSTNASGLISLCYPFFTLESILPLLGVQTYIRHGRLNRDETVAANRRRLENVYLPIRGELAAGEVSLTEVQGVQVGDVIRAETQVHEPTVLYVGDEPKFLGLPFAGKGDRFTVKISEILDPAAAERLKNRCRPVQFLRQN